MVQSKYLLAAVGVPSVTLWIILSDEPEGSAGPELSTISIPRLSEHEEAGRILFDANCSACHGVNAVGTNRGPPLVHRIYEPGHHADLSFLLAVRRGVLAHHWQFGSMPAIDEVSDEDVAMITAYVRALQRANGIN